MYILEVSKRLNSVVIENQDFGNIIKTYDKKDALFYLYPPYYETEKHYPDRFMPDDHIRLKNVLERIEGRFLLSYNNCEYIWDLYSEYNIIEIERMNNFLHKSESGNPRYRELLIKNY